MRYTSNLKYQSQRSASSLYVRTPTEMNVNNKHEKINDNLHIGEYVENRLF
jgi:hypothetical protein